MLALKRMLLPSYWLGSVLRQVIGAHLCISSLLVIYTIDSFVVWMRDTGPKREQLCGPGDRCQDREDARTQRSLEH